MRRFPRLARKDNGARLAPKGNGARLARNERWRPPILAFAAGRRFRAPARIGQGLSQHERRKNQWRNSWLLPGYTSIKGLKPPKIMRFPSKGMFSM